MSNLTNQEWMDRAGDAIDLANDLMEEWLSTPAEKVLHYHIARVEEDAVNDLEHLPVSLALLDGAILYYTRELALRESDQDIVARMMEAL